MNNVILLLKIFNELKGIDRDDLSTAELNILNHLKQAGVIEVSSNWECGFDLKTNDNRLAKPYEN